MIYYIITGILYLLMISFVLKLYYSYHKEIEELKNKIKKFENINGVIFSFDDIDKLDINKIINWLKELKESDSMACKKGRGGRKK